MSSSGWEIVGRNKKDKSNGKPAKLTKAEKKKFIENTPKVEDFLPLTQVKTLYDNFDTGANNKKKENEKEKKTKEKQENKKPQQKVQDAAEITKQKPKEKPAKSIEEALKMINTDEMREVLSTSMLRFPELPLVWLKDLAAYLNVKIPIDKEDSVFSGKPKDYPLCIVPEDICSILKKALEMAGTRNAQIFYETSLTAMSTDMVKGVTVVGYKIFLQLLATSQPEMTAECIPKLISIRNSYQNRKPIGLSLLWVMSQAGRKNLTVGLKLWHEVMAPMLEGKNYKNYVVQILKELVFEHGKATDLSLELYLDIVSDVYSGKYNLPLEVARDVNISIDKLRSILFQNQNIRCPKLFEVLLKNDCYNNPKLQAKYRDELVKALAACLSADANCFSVWRLLYAKNLYQSHLLLTYIAAKWDILKKTLKVKCLKETCVFFQTTNEKWKKSRDENLALQCRKLSGILLSKMTVSNKRKFSWGKGIVFLLIIISAIVAYDIQKRGSFEASSTGRFLERNGICAYGRKAWLKTQQYTEEGLRMVEASSPEYYKAVVDTCKPYIKLTRDFYLVAKSFSIKIYENILIYGKTKGPVLVNTIEHYVPGMMDEIHHRFSQSLKLGKEYLEFLTEKISEHSATSIRWLEQNIFVGKLSPKNLQTYCTQAIDTTQTLASQTYDWVYEKMQTFSKIS